MGVAGPLATHSSHQKHLASNRGSLVEKDRLPSPVENTLISALEIFGDPEEFGFLPTVEFSEMS